MGYGLKCIGQTCTHESVWNGQSGHGGYKECILREVIPVSLYGHISISKFENGRKVLMKSISNGIFREVEYYTADGRTEQEADEFFDRV